MLSPTAEQSILAALDAKYEITGPLDVASGAALLLARQRQTDVQMALRIVAVPNGGDLEIAERIAQAAATAAQLHHPHIARIYGVAAVTAEAVAIATEHIPGHTLRQILQASRELSPADAERVLRAVAGALEMAHRNGVVHGGVQPTNILIEEESGRILLVGFGESLASTLGAADASGAGRNPYAAPEHRYGGLADVRTDLYGLGLVGWEMLSGRLPSAADNPGEVLFKQTHGGSGVLGRLPAATPPRLLLALEGALQWDRPLRWSSAAALLHQLSQDVATPEAQRRHSRIVGVTPSRPAPTPRAAKPVDDAVALQQVRETAVNRVADPVEATQPLEYDQPFMPGQRLPEWGKAIVLVLPAILLGSVAAVALANRNGGGLSHLVPADGAVRSAVAAAVSGGGRGPGVGVARAPRASAGLVPAAAGLGRRAAVAPSSPPAAAPLPPSAQSSGSRLDSVAEAANHARARDHYVRGTNYLNPRSPAGVLAAIDEYMAAIKLDSSVAAPYEGLARAYAAVLQQGWYETQHAADVATTHGLAAAERALLLDPRSEQSLVARGTLLEFRNPRSLDDAVASYRQALALAPEDAEARRQYARAAAYTGDFRMADEQYRRALAQAPHSAAVLCDLAELAYFQRDLGEAKKLLDAAVAADPRNPDAYLLRVRMRLGDAQFRDAWSDAEMAARLGDPLPGAAASVLVSAQTGDSADARRRADALMRDVRKKDGVVPVLESRYLALTLMAIGERDAAMEILERAYPRGATLWFALQDPGFRQLRGLARFDQLTSASRATSTATP